MDWIKAKLAGLEDHCRKNNVKIRSIPETVQPAALPEYFKQLLAAFLPDAPPTDLIIDRIHRLPKPSHLSRDTIVRIHLFHTKEKFMRAAKKLLKYP